MNATNCSAEHLCSNQTINQNSSRPEYADVRHFFRVVAVIMNSLTCPPTILLNALVIMAVKTKQRLQTIHNILLASLAGTDLVVGIAAQPAFIGREIFRLTGGSMSVFGTLYDITQTATTSLCLASLFHLVLISIERFVAMKYSLRYNTIVTKFRLTVAVACSWLIAITYCVLKMASPKIVKSTKLAHLLAVISLLVIIYCHISVYFVCRRHKIQIKSEQVSQEATAKFLEEKKAWKTTGIIIGGVLTCYFLGLVAALAITIFPDWTQVFSSFSPFRMSCFILNSLLNPIIYCWRSTAIREAMIQLLKRQGN
ncbi:alpha-1A adrenergic receptor-like [Oculina patagonica]